jgi:hypothetical protein
MVRSTPEYIHCSSLSTAEATPPPLCAKFIAPHYESEALLNAVRHERERSRHAAPWLQCTQGHVRKAREGDGWRVHPTQRQVRPAPPPPPPQPTCSLVMPPLLRARFDASPSSSCRMMGHGFGNKRQLSRGRCSQYPLRNAPQTHTHDPNSLALLVSCWKFDITKNLHQRAQSSSNCSSLDESRVCLHCRSCVWLGVG